MLPNARAGESTPPAATPAPLEFLGKIKIEGLPRECLLKEALHLKVVSVNDSEERKLVPDPVYVKLTWQRAGIVGKDPECPEDDVRVWGFDAKVTGTQPAGPGEKIIHDRYQVAPEKNGRFQLGVFWYGVHLLNKADGPKFETRTVEFSIPVTMLAVQKVRGLAEISRSIEEKYAVWLEKAGTAEYLVAGNGGSNRSNVAVTRLAKLAPGIKVDQLKAIFNQDRLLVAWISRVKEIATLEWALLCFKGSLINFDPEELVVWKKGSRKLTSNSQTLSVQTGPGGFLLVCQQENIPAVDIVIQAETGEFSGSKPSPETSVLTKASPSKPSSTGQPELTPNPSPAGQLFPLAAAGIVVLGAACGLTLIIAWKKRQRISHPPAKE